MDKEKDQAQQSTNQVLDSLIRSNNFEAFLDSNSGDIVETDFGEYLTELCESKDIEKSDVIKRSGIERSYGYQLFKGTRTPSRDKVLQLAVGLSLGLDETQKLLKMARKSELYPRIKRDAAVIFAIERKMKMIDLQAFLAHLGENPLGEDAE